MKLSFSKLLDNKRFLMILSLILAAISWMLVVTYISTIESNTIDHVPVDLSAQQDQYLAPKSLNVITKDDMTVKVEIKADRKLLSELKQKPESLSVYADLSDIPLAGTYDVPLEVAGMKGVTVLSITPSTATLRIDRQATEKYTVTPKLINLSVPDDYVAQDTVVNPKTIEITGPEADIQRIVKCEASVTFTEPLTKTETKSAEIKLYTAEGMEIPTDSLVMTTKNVDITVPVYKQKQLKVRFQYTGYPQDFPLDEFQYTLSEDTVTVAGPNSVVDNLEYLDIGYVALNEIDKGKILTFEVSLPNGVNPINAPESITVAFDLDDVGSSNFTIPETNIFLKNVPTNYDVTLLTKSISNVRVLGDEAILETLTAQDLVAEIDLSNKEPSTGPYNLPVTISAPGKGFVWAVNGPEPYMAIVSIKEKIS